MTRKVWRCSKFIKVCVWFNTFTKLPHHLYSQREFLMHEEKKVGEKKKLPFSIFAKKTKWGFACQDILYNNINVVHIAAKITKWPQAKISIKSNYPSLFFWKVIFFCFAFAEKVPLHFGIDFWAGWNNTMTPNSVQKTLYFCLLYLSETILYLFVT